MGASVDDERSRQVRHREQVEARGAALPSTDEPGYRATLGRVRRATMPAARRAQATAIRLSRPVRRLALAALAAPSSRRRASDERMLSRRLEALPPAPPGTRRITCIVFGTAGGLAERAARSAGAAVEVVPREGPRPPIGPADLICVMASETEPLGHDWMARLVAAIEGDVVAAAPVLVHPRRRSLHATPQDGAVRASGFDAALDGDGAPIMRAREAGTEARLEDRVDHVFAVPGACVVVDRDAFERAGGWSPTADLDVAMVDLCMRLRAGGGRVGVVHNAVAIDHRPLVVPTRPATPIDVGARAWRALVDRRGPELWRYAVRRPEPDTILQFAVTIAAPSETMAPRWGDWHLAGALARALERLGHIVRVQTADHADDAAGRSCDVHLVLRGLQPVRRTPGQRHVLWVISHPDEVDMRECDDADLVLVASSKFAADLAARTSTPIEVLLQATDQHRFRPRTPVSGYAHPVAVVAKTRDVPRPIVMDAIAAGLRPAIYGTGWEDFVDPSLVVASYVPNADLPVLYSSVGVLLADHWRDMREWGFVSNRVFDALACSTALVTDDLAEIAALFGDAVRTYRTPDDLRTSVEEILAEPEEAAARAGRGRDVVVGAHTFDHRAREMLSALARHGLLGPIRDRPDG
jgi:hypothetical protein